jgi:hypothetical protein
MERVNPKNTSYPEKPVDFDVVADAGPTESTSVATAATNTPSFIDLPLSPQSDSVLSFIAFADSRQRSTCQ